MSTYQWMKVGERWLVRGEEVPEDGSVFSRALRAGELIDVKRRDGRVVSQCVVDWEIHEGRICYEVTSPEGALGKGLRADLEVYWAAKNRLGEYRKLRADQRGGGEWLMSDEALMVGQIIEIGDGVYRVLGDIHREQIDALSMVGEDLRLLQPRAGDLEVSTPRLAGQSGWVARVGRIEPGAETQWRSQRLLLRAFSNEMLNDPLAAANRVVRMIVNCGEELFDQTIPGGLLSPTPEQFKAIADLEARGEVLWDQSSADPSVEALAGGYRVMADDEWFYLIDHKPRSDGSFEPGSVWRAPFEPEQAEALRRASDINRLQPRVVLMARYGLPVETISVPELQDAAAVIEHIRQAGAYVKAVPDSARLLFDVQMPSQWNCKVYLDQHDRSLIAQTEGGGLMAVPALPQLVDALKAGQAAANHGTAPLIEATPIRDEAIAEVMRIWRASNAGGAINTPASNTAPLRAPAPSRSRIGENNYER